MRRALVATLVLALLVASAGSPRAVEDHLSAEYLASIDNAIVHGSVTPPGAQLLDKESERRAYDDLVQGYPTLTDEQINTRYFKDGRFGPVTDVLREYRPRSDVRIVRDRKWGVPHIYGETDAAAAFGAGYAAIEDRLPIIIALNALGRAEAFELLGTAPAWLADAEIVRLYGYTEDEFQQMIDRMPAVYGQPGQDLVDLLDQLVLGMNHALADIASGHLPMPVALADAGLALPAPFRATDIVSIVSIIRALFGAGGGGEMGNAARWASLIAAHGPTAAERIWEDFRNRENKDGLVHTESFFPYQQVPATVDRDAHPVGVTPGRNGIEGILDEIRRAFPGGAAQAAAQLGSLAESGRIKHERLRLDTPLGTIDLSRPGQMSNHVVVDGTLSSSGHPILLGGPQSGYFDPQILVENEIHGDRLHARGAGFPGMGFVVIGRNPEAAWTPTSGGSDMIDTYVEELCHPDGSTPTEESHYYRFNDQCVEMDRRVLRAVTDAAPAELPGRDLLADIVVERSVHGPVVARGRLGDKPVAVSYKRSTYGKELDAGVSILKLNRNEVPDGRTFVEVFEESHNLSTNWAYANADEIAYVHGGLYPLRPARVHPDFPVWGTGQWEWHKDAAGNDVYLEHHPSEVAPSRRYIVSWNNRPARGWASSDSNWSHSALYRADMLEDQVLQQAPGSVTPVRLVQIMEHAGLTDFRGSHVLPVVLRVLEAGAPPSGREAQMRDLLAEWMTAGALRRDGDRDGSYDQGSAVAIMDALWERMIRRIYDPILGDVSVVGVNGLHNAPSSIGSAFQDGFYGQVWTDLSMVLGDPVRSPTSQAYCGSNELGVSGTLSRCAARLWAAIKAAGDDLGGQNPAAWNADAEAERIVFLPNVTLTMHWVNRPTTQVLAMFGRRSVGRKGAGEGDEDASGPPSLPATGRALSVPAAVLAAVGLLLLGAGRNRRLGARTSDS